MRNAVKSLLPASACLLLLACSIKPPPFTWSAEARARSAARVASAEAGRDAPDSDAGLRKRGYRPQQIDGTLKYCRSETLTGTHFSNTVCRTREEIMATQVDTQTNLDQLGKAGRAVCPNNKCD